LAGMQTCYGLLNADVGVAQTRRLFRYHHRRPVVSAAVALKMNKTKTKIDSSSVCRHQHVSAHANIVDTPTDRRWVDAHTQCESPTHMSNTKAASDIPAPGHNHTGDKGDLFLWFFPWLSAQLLDHTQGCYRYNPDVQPNLKTMKKKVDPLEVNPATGLDSMTMEHRSSPLPSHSIQISHLSQTRRRRHLSCLRGCVSSSALELSPMMGTLICMEIRHDSRVVRVVVSSPVDPPGRLVQIASHGVR